MPPQGRPDSRADLVLLGGRIWPGRGLAQTEALAVRGERILAIGTDEAIRPLVGGGTRVVELNGRRVVPGFNDAHVHFLAGGTSLLSVDLRDAESRTEVAARIRRHAQALPKGAWLLEGNWDHEGWPAQELPEREFVDAVVSDHPVFLSRLDRHMALANSLALRLAHVTRDTPDPEGGQIERDSRGEPTGILKDNAMELVTRVIPEPTRQASLQAALAALQEAARLGVTTIQDNSVIGAFPVYEELRRQGKLSARLDVWRPISALASLRDAGIPFGLGDDWLRLGALKILADGSMGSGTAAFFEPYADDASERGFLLYPPDELSRLIREADAAGYQVAVHAIGDLANSVVLDAFDEVARAHPARDRRFRIEHAQVVRPGDRDRYAALGVIASIQPSHAIDDMRWAEKRIGLPRCLHAYNVRSFLEADIAVAFGTDWPVESLDPRVGLYAAVTRELQAGGPPDGWQPKEKISLEQALDCYTRGSAHAQFSEDRKGRLEPGMLADLVVFGSDLLDVPAREILTSPVELTVVGGRVVFEQAR